MGRKSEGGSLEYVPAKPGERFGHYRVRLNALPGRPYHDFPPSPRSPQQEKRCRERARAFLERYSAGKLAPALAGKVDPPSEGETFDDYVERWFADRERRGLTSIKTDRGRIRNHVSPIIGPKPVAKIDADDLRDVVEALDRKVEGGEFRSATAVKTWGLVTKLFADAHKSKVRALRVRSDNPARDVAGPEKQDQDAKQWLFPSEVEALLACEAVPLRWRRLYALMIYLYVRPGELAGLEWIDVDLARGTVEVRRALDLRTGKTKGIKTSRSGVVRRTIPIHDELHPLLADLHRQSGGEGRVVVHGHANKDAEHGFPPLEDLAATLRAHLLRAGVTRHELHHDAEGSRRMRFYGLRDTGITHEVFAGTDHVRIMQRAGHKSFETTKRYVHAVEDKRLAPGEQPFPPLPPTLIGKNCASNCAFSESAPRVSARSEKRKVASPTGFEPVLQP